MSGFAGVFHLDGAPVDRAWLEIMAEFLAFRGPDGSQVWVSGEAGLCLTLLRTSTETDDRPLISNLDDRLWIAGDIRIDDRAALIAKLPGSLGGLRTASSSELILHAYDAWGEACLDHLLGDFSFVIWDAGQKRVLGARDHMGVKPFYFAKVGQSLLISNTLDCIRQIPIVSKGLNDRAIGDFLLVGRNKHSAETFFAEIQRLPGSHCLIAGSDGLRTDRYWTLPIEEPVYYKRACDYVDRFLDLLRTAVRDRLPDGPLGILMSGGLDSPALAAIAVELGASTTAFTSVFDSLIPDEEGQYAGLVTEYLGIPIHYMSRDDEPWGWEPGSAPAHTPEPTADPLALASHFKSHRDLSVHGRVFFYGNGPDAALLYEWKQHLSWLIGKRRWVRLGRDLIADFAASRRIPVFHRLSRTLKERKNQEYQPAFPTWINKEFEARFRLKERWEEVHRNDVLPHPTRPMAYECFACDLPFDGVEGLDAGCTRVASDFFQPFWDLRLLRFLLTVPAVPWCRDKYLIRTALKGLIPEAVRLRPKASFSGLPYLEHMRRSGIPELPPVPELDCYVEISRLPKELSSDRQEVDDKLRILGLQYWFLSL